MFVTAGGGVLRYVMRRVGILTVLLAAALPVPAQDGDLGGLLLIPVRQADVEDVSATGFQIYRIPLSYPLRRLEDKPWGLRITMPISFGTYELESATDIGDVVESIRSVAIIPGVEALLPAGERWLLRPFAEVGIGDDSRTGESHLLYAAGIRARGEYAARPFELMAGAAFRYRSAGGSEVVNGWYSTVEAGFDAQLPLGFAVGSRQARGGAYAIARYFPDLELVLSGDALLQIEWGYELGVSFSTDPVLRVWKIKLPWIGLGYRFGDKTQGVRLSFDFPF